MKPYIFGVDIGGTTVKMGLFQSDGTKIEQWEIPTRTENKSEQLLPDIAEAIFNRCLCETMCQSESVGRF